MRAILLAAGFGTRLRPLTDTTPKCLVPILGRPLLDIWLEILTAAGFGPFLINTHYLRAAVDRFVSASRYASNVTLAYEPRLFGTGGTILANREFFDRRAVFVAHADNLCVCDLRAFEAAHRARPSDCAMTMMTFVTDAPHSCGIVELDRRGVVVGLHEKHANPPDNLANAAVYILEPEVIDCLSSLGRPVIDFSTEVLPRFVGRIHTWLNRDIHFDIGTMAGLQAAERSFRRWQYANSRGAN